MNSKELLDKLKNTRILAIIGLVSILLGILLPYVRYSFFGSYITASLWRSWQGILVLLLTIANAIIIFKDYVEKYIPKLLDVPLWKKISNINNPKITLIPTVASVILVVLLYVTLEFRPSSYSIGFYTLWLGIICLIAYAIINKGNITSSNNSNNGTQQNVNPINNTMNNYNNGKQQNMNPNYNNMNNYNNGMSQNMNTNYNNMPQQNVNQSYKNVNNYNNGTNLNVNPNYNNPVNYNTNQNNGMEPNVNPNYNNMNNYNNRPQQNMNPNYNNMMNNNLNPNYNNTINNNDKSNINNENNNK